VEDIAAAEEPSAPEPVNVPSPPEAATSIQKVAEPAHEPAEAAKPDEHKTEEPAKAEEHAPPAAAEESKVAAVDTHAELKADEHAATEAEAPKPAEAEHAEGEPAEPAKTDDHAEAEPAEAEAPEPAEDSAALAADLPAADSLTAGKQVIRIWLGQDFGQDPAARKAFDGDGGAKTRFAPLLDSYALEVRQFVTVTNTAYRVYVGPVESLQKAQELCAKIKERDGGQACRPVIN
jgi:hypothetical protein